MTNKTLAPSGWPEAEREHWWAIQHAPLPGNPVAQGYGGAIATAINAVATRAGLEALKQGGSAMDAALTTALTQIVLGGGAVTSFFGILQLMHFDAEKGEASSMSASWNTVLGEDDPLTIPGERRGASSSITDMMALGEPSGRTALVGGFMRGLEEAHRRHGRLPFRRLFEPAIELAEEGFTVFGTLARYIELRKEDLSRLPATRSIFFKDDGTPYVTGDHFRQPQLAETLRRVAVEGADYMYTGAWAARCVAAIQADGGKMTHEDLARYRPIWSEPILIERNGRTLALPSGPCKGSINLVEALNLATAAGLTERPHWSSSGDSLVRIAKCCAVAGLSYATKEQLEAEFPGFDMSDEVRMTQGHADRLWERLDGPGMIHFQPIGTHSDDVVAIDAQGNMVSLCHSINCLIWGRTAINVDGISIGDSAAVQQPLVAATPRGGALPNPIELGLILKDDRPEIAWASMGMGLHYQSTMSVLNVVDHGMTIVEAVDAPRLLTPLQPDMKTREYTLRVVEGEYPESVLDETGLEVISVAQEDARFAQGLWVAIQRDTASGVLTAISPSYTNGQAAALD
ncbi:gamma-glutamyltransferase [Tsuneonella rigui]|uniref:gamma-glutamyltransferase n=1 Tax=Tsuneonella rigui TaxID=1708790 RepID=UPI000F7F4C4C|nr:gamma-glutamyltransferase [Tsuneonella rigui]